MFIDYKTINPKERQTAFHIVDIVNLPTAVVNEHSIASTIVDVESKSEVECLGFL